MGALLTLNEAASVLKVHRETLRQWAVAGTVPHVR
ncbi:MAG: helix-turn-helix domain-containing protein, partial [Nitrososphaera sp.]